MNIKVSVIMPVYNAEKYLSEAIDSILNQTFTDFEFLIINDGSTDSSLEIINRYSDQRIVLINNDGNIGLTKSLNKGIENAKGQYIARMDADDISFKDRLERQVSVMDDNIELGLCSGNFVPIDDHGKIIDRSVLIIKRQDRLPIEWKMLWDNPIIHPATMIRRQILYNNNLLYDIAHRDEDYNLWCKITLITKICSLQVAVIKYRVTDDSFFISTKKQNLNDALRSNSELLKNITHINPPPFHEDFTAFKKELADDINYCYEIKDVITWFYFVAECAAERWRWDKTAIINVNKDISKKIINYILMNPVNILTKFKLILLHVNLKDIIQIAYDKFKYYYLIKFNNNMLYL